MGSTVPKEKRVDCCSYLDIDLEDAVRDDEGRTTFDV